MPSLLSRAIRLLLPSASIVLSTVPASAQAISGTNSLPELTDPHRVQELQKLTLEDLLITSVSKKPEKAFDAAAAVAVISGDEIRRSGVRSLGEALRMAPGVDVAQKDSSDWAISSRGANGVGANKFLVLVDGRSIYNVANSGVNWWSRGVPLGDIDRIEVIRGPGGTLYGANAVNGVVNIITRDAQQTQGWYSTAGYGSYHEGFVETRYGNKVGENGFMRTYFKYDNVGSFANPDGSDAFDAWNRYQGGARADWHFSENQLTLEADYIYGQREQLDLYPSFSPPYVFFQQDRPIDRMPSALARWRHEFPDATDLQFQVYWDEVDRSSPLYAETTDTFDIDFQHRILLPLRQELIYGLGYRYISSRVKNVTPNLLFFPPTRNLDLVSGFVQDEISLIPSELKFILGTKLEHNDYTGFEVEPNARLAWTPTEKQTVWSAISRAVRTPSRTEPDVLVDIPGPIPTGNPPPFDRLFIQGIGNPDFESEVLIAYELGYRIRPIDILSFDLATYYFQYDRMESPETLPPYFNPFPAPGHLTLPIRPANNGQVDTYGFEIAAEWQAQDWWRLRSGYSYFGYRNQENVSFDNAATAQHNFFAISSMDLPRDIEFDLWLRYKSEVESYGVDAYVEMDARIAWKPKPNFELAVVGQNLLHDQRRDFGIPRLSLGGVTTEVVRGVYGQVTFRF